MYKADSASELNAMTYSASIIHTIAELTYKSPGVRTLECFWRNGPTASRTSSMPVLAWKVSSVSLKVAIEPSAPPPLLKNESPRNIWRGGLTYPNEGEIPMASWNTRRSAP